MNSVIEAHLTTSKLTFQPGGPPVSFGVGVINRSDQFASFQVEVCAAGADDDSHWYRLSPDVSTAKSPGDHTEFQVTILQPPIPDFVGTINLMVRVSSPQLLDEQRLVLRLVVEPSQNPNHLRLSLPTQQFQVYPRNQVEIPVTVRNLGTQATEVRVRCQGLNAAWLVGSHERHVAVAPDGEATVTFACQPPGADQVPSRAYPFVMTASSLDESTAEISGHVDVLPVGFIQFDVQPHRQRVPAKWSWFPRFKVQSAHFQLLFNNTSNLEQVTDVEVRGRDAQACKIQVSPHPVALPIGQLTPANLMITPRRPWLGWPRQLQLEVKPRLSDPRLGSCDPATQRLLLKVLPRIPLWLLVGLAAIATALFRPPSVTHLSGVNAVQLSGTSGRVPLVLSASDDCTIRSWSTAAHTLTPQGTLSPDIPPTTCTTAQPASAKGLLATTPQAVRSLALVPVNNNQLFAGLENGTLQVWDINTGQQLYSLRDTTDQTSDRILDLQFSRNALTLYSSYGSGTIRQWQRPQTAPFPSQPSHILQLPPPLTFQTWSLALSPDEQTLVSAGQFKRLILWDVSDAQPSPRQLLDTTPNRGANDFIWDIDFAPKAPTLATSDSDGHITLWDLSQCRTVPSDPIPQTQCAQQSHWQVSNTAIRSIQFTPDQRWLISAGDDGKIIAWPLTAKLTQDTTQKPQHIATLPHRLTSIDVITNEQGIWIASGSEDAQVRLHRFTPSP